MTTWFVTRHPGAVLWARNAGLRVADGGIVRDLDVRRVEAGDLVVGTLPIHLAAEVSERGARYLHLALEVPPEARGRELTPDEMTAFGARLEEYRIERARSTEVAPAAKSASEILVCIASGQPMANLLPLVLRRPQRLCVIESADEAAVRTSRRLQQIARLLELPCVVRRNAPSAPLAAVEAFADELLADLRRKYPDHTFVLNATGGTKLMSIAFANRVAPLGEVLYCDTEHDLIETLAPEGRAALPMPPDLLNIPVLMLAQGIEVMEAASDDAGWMKRARARVALGKKLAGMGEDWVYGLINRLASQAEPRSGQGARAKPFVPRQEVGRKITRRIAKLFDQIATHGLWSRADVPGARFSDAVDGAALAVHFSSEEAVRYLKGGWLEELAAVELERLCKQHGIPPGHWAAGVKLRPAGAQAESGKVFNELDLIVVWRNRLLIVECKTGVQAADDDQSRNVINQLEAIRHYLGGPFSSIWLASARKLHAHSVAADRCRQYGVKVLDPKGLDCIGDLVAGWMGIEELPPGSR